tara:strand:+ start:6003 stop:6809 length:807 start_codon:yes stop_codon:yes gene_type:complete
VCLGFKKKYFGGQDMSENTDVVQILWTGGWDSTYRVISLVESGYLVQPHYIMDPARPSRFLEVETIAKISNILNQDFGNRVLDLKVVDLDSIHVPVEVSKSYDQIRSQCFVGSQYKWLAAYTLINELDALELAIHKDDRACDVVSSFIVKNYQGSHVLGTDAPVEIKAIFGRFSYPIIDMTKSDMKNNLVSSISKEVMALTWFCHTPAFGRYPCGHCNPCIYTAKEGLINRLPWHAKIRYHIRLYPRLKDILIKYPKLHSFFIKLKRT